MHIPTQMSAFLQKCSSAEKPFHICFRKKHFFSPLKIQLKKIEKFQSEKKRTVKILVKISYFFQNKTGSFMGSFEKTN